MKLGEYWLTDRGSLIPADGEYGDSHEDVVINFVINRVLDSINRSDLEFSDRTEFRCWLNDEYFPEAYGWDEEEPYEKLAATFSKISKNPVQELSVLMGRGDGDDDARIVAIDLWGWIRIAGFSAELNNLSGNNLKRLGEGLVDALFEEGYEGDEKELMDIQVRVSTYSGSGNQNRSMTIGELLDDGRGASGANLSQSASDALRRADIAIQPAYYGSRLGDSLVLISTLLEQVISEDAGQDALYRVEAKGFALKLRNWLTNIKNEPLEELHPLIQTIRDPRYSGGLALKAGRIDERYSDLVIVMLPEDKIRVDTYQITGGFGRSKDRTTSVICVNNLLEPNSLKHCDTRLNLGTFIHEFVHYLDSKREKGSSGSSVEELKSSDSSYFNSSGEYNAYFQEMASDLDSMFGRDSWLRSSPDFERYSTWEGFKELAKRVSNESWQQLMNPAYQRKFLRRLYGLWKHLCPG
jgi:hypothetical protein